MSGRRGRRSWDGGDDLVEPRFSERALPMCGRRWSGTSPGHRFRFFRGRILTIWSGIAGERLRPADHLFDGLGRHLSRRQ